LIARGVVKEQTIAVIGLQGLKLNTHVPLLN
jgi:hypothetical protein